MQPQLAALDRLVQGMLGVEAANDVSPGVVVEHTDARTSGGLRFVHRDVGVAEDDLG